MFNIEMAYQMECCGDLPTRRGKIERYINELARSPDPNDEYTQQYLFNESGLESLTLDEIDYIEKEVYRRR